MTTEPSGEQADERLLRELDQLLGRIDPPPAHVLEAARLSFAWRSWDAQLAQLTADSLADSAPVRGGSARLLTFETGDSVIDVEVAEHRGRLRILGQVAPPQRARVRVEQAAGSTETLTDDLGRFAVPDLPAGLTRFSVHFDEPTNGATGGDSGATTDGGVDEPTGGATGFQTEWTAL